jgi:4-diphosphocytidyl-2-C-methyl-D-erythritol kinase
MDRHLFRQNSYTRLTLALDIIQKIPEGPLQGYHEMGIIKHQISLCDTLELREAEETSISCDVPEVPLGRDNICWQAAELMRRRFSKKSSFHITIQKRIPLQGGLAGGSANAATTISLINKAWGLGLPRKDLARLGREIGMDVPFYFYGNTAHDTEATGILTPLKCTTHLHFVLVTPGFGISTPRAFAHVNCSKTGRKTALTEEMKHHLQTGSYSGITACIHNDFELSLSNNYPALGEIQKKLMEYGCDAACITGSGSTVVGIAENKSTALYAARNFSHAICSETKKQENTEKQ